MPQVVQDLTRKANTKVSKSAGCKSKGDHMKAKGVKPKGKSVIAVNTQRTEGKKKDIDQTAVNTALLEELKTHIERSQLQEDSTDVYRVYDWKKKTEKKKEKFHDHSSYICIPDKWVREKFDECRATQSDIVLPSELRSNPERRIEEAFNRFRHKTNLGRTVSLDDFSSTSKVGQLTQFWNTLLGNGIEAVEKKCAKGIEKEESSNVIKMAEKVIPKRGRVKLKMPYFPPVCRRPRIRERVFDRSAIRRAGRYRGRRVLRPQLMYSDVAIVPSPDPSTFITRIITRGDSREFRPARPQTPVTSTSDSPDRELSDFSFDEKVTYNDVVATMEKLQALLTNSRHLQEIEVPRDVGRQIVNLKNVLEEEKEKEEPQSLPKTDVPEKPRNPKGVSRAVGFSMNVMMNGPYQEYVENMAFHGGWARVLNPPKETVAPSPHSATFEELPVFYASVSYDRGDCFNKLAPYIYHDSDKEITISEKGSYQEQSETWYGGGYLRNMCIEIVCMPGRIVYMPVALLLNENTYIDGSLKIMITIIFYLASFIYLFR